MCLSYLLLAVVVVAAGADHGRIYFPGDLDHAEHDSCNTHAGTPGTCESSCGAAADLGILSKCGIKESAFLYCCEPVLSGKTSERTLDTSPPSTTFQCGINIKNYYAFSQFDIPGQILRPEAALPPPGASVTKNPPPVRPGIPLKALDEYNNDDTTLPEGYYAVAAGIVAQKNSWPWMALLGERKENVTRWYCGGVLINEQWVLSALHCFFRHAANVVRLSEHDYGDDNEGAYEIDFDVETIVYYPDFKRPEAYHDLALLKLSSPVTIENTTAPVCLPWGREMDSDMLNKTATISGWGDTEYGGFPSTILQEANVTVFESEQCDRSYSHLPHYPSTWPKGIQHETLCAGDPDGGRDACQGDSGGPLVTQDDSGRFMLAGIVSRGYGCGHKDYPGLYANLRHPPYLAWIKKVAFGTQ